MIVSLNLTAHIWIFYTFLVNGFVVSHLFCIRSRNYAELLETMEARILSSFFLSIVINGTVLLLWSKVGYDFSSLRVVLPLVTVLILILLWYELVKRKKKVTLPDWNWGRMVLYSFVFVLLSVNGGLIESLADSWWHLSLANKISVFSSFEQELVVKHLSGVSGRHYPPLWHGNLAMLQKMSAVSLPLLWNSFTPWGGVFKVMGFYLLALGLCNNKGMALLSAMLFVLLPGLGDSYLRVSAWPSHISYTAWFCMFYISFVLFDKCRRPVPVVQKNSLPGLIPYGVGFVRQNRVLLISFLLLTGVVFFLHRAELLWFALGMLFYALLLVSYNLFSDLKSKSMEPGMGILRLYIIVGMACVLSVSWLKYSSFLFSVQGFSDLHLIVLLFIGIAVFFLYSVTENSFFRCVYSRNIAKLTFIAGGLILLLSIDIRQLSSLFSPELAYPRAVHHGKPIFCSGWLGGQLMLPDWNMQLRHGLLYSGVLAVVLSVVMVFKEPKRCTLFLAANSVIPFFFLVSPYLYQWLMDILQYESSWRLALLIFHPIVLACFLFYIWGVLMNRICGQ